MCSHREPPPPPLHHHRKSDPSLWQRVYLIGALRVRCACLNAYAPGTDTHVRSFRITSTQLCLLNGMAWDMTCGRTSHTVLVICSLRMGLLGGHTTQTIPTQTNRRRNVAAHLINMQTPSAERTTEQHSSTASSTFNASSSIPARGRREPRHKTLKSKIETCFAIGTHVHFGLYSTATGERAGASDSAFD